MQLKKRFNLRSVAMTDATVSVTDVTCNSWNATMEMIAGASAIQIRPHAEVTSPLILRSVAMTDAVVSVRIVVWDLWNVMMGTIAIATIKKSEKKSMKALSRMLLYERPDFCVLHL